MEFLAAMIVAAGRGDRFGGATPKQFVHLGGEPMVRRAARAFLGVGTVNAVRIVINPDDQGLAETALSGLDGVTCCAGGRTRQQSVLAGLESLVETSPDIVLIHDAARPFVDGACIGRVVQAAREHGAAIAAMPVTDTLKRSAIDETAISGTVDRGGLWRAQTPQGFRFADILAGHRMAAGRTDLTDDAAVIEAAGQTVRLVMGSEANVKVTTAEDWAMAEARLATPFEQRVGSGFDVHRWQPGSGLVLCGVPIDFDRRLAGHSDADVGLHALTDALLGSLAAGDIGQHFPPSDPRWNGHDSSRFLAFAVDLLAQRRGRLIHADLTILGERPRIGPHAPRIRARLSQLLSVPEDRVSIKATTTEGLGFLGRQEGLAAHAVVTVALPVGSPPDD